MDVKKKRKLKKLRAELSGKDASGDIVVEGLDKVAELLQELIGTLKIKELKVTVPDEVRVSNLGDITPDVEIKNEPKVEVKGKVKTEIVGTPKVLAEIVKEPAREKVVPSVKETTAAIKSLEIILGKIIKAGLSVRLDESQRKNIVPIRVMPVDEKGKFMPAGNNTTVFGRGGGAFSQQSKALLEEIVDKLTEVVQNTADIELKAENVNLNTDELEAILNDVLTDLDGLNAKDFATEASLATLKTQGNLYHGKQASITGTRIQIAASGTVFNSGVLLRADPNNTATIYIGGASVTTANGMPLAPGDSMQLDINDIGLLYAITATPTQTVYYIGS